MTKKILFIEDESALQKAVTRVLSETGYEMVSALDGVIGLELAKKEKPDLILLDLILPRMDGFAVLESLKKDLETQAIPVVVLSNLETSEDVERIMALGALAYLVKANYGLEEIVQKVKEFLPLP